MTSMRVPGHMPCHDNRYLRQMQRALRIKVKLSNFQKKQFNGPERLKLASTSLSASNTEAPSVRPGPAAEPSAGQDQSASLQKRFDMSVDDLDEEISHRSSTVFLSVMDVFKIGIGPSSSHTMGPMVATNRFLELLNNWCSSSSSSSSSSNNGNGSGGYTAVESLVSGLRVILYGSLAHTGVGHATDRAAILGLAGFRPDTFDAGKAEAVMAEINASKTVQVPFLTRAIKLDPKTDVVFDYGQPLPGHANGMVVQALDSSQNVLLQETFYSIGGGFVLSAAEQEAVASGNHTSSSAALPVPYPYPFTTALQMMKMTQASGKTIAEMQRANELIHRTEEQLKEGLARVWAVMNGCIDRGLNSTGMLPGGLKVMRRASKIYQALKEEETGARPSGAPHTSVVDWLLTYAMAVNEENAAGGRVVTAPTNGAAGVIPAVIRYWLDHVPGASEDRVGDFLLTSAAVGALVKRNASISGAECGCQAEVGSAAAMAAAGLAAMLGGTPRQVENAAEIALEHHLGMTCDPIGGLVQVPCIERNGLGAIKAVSAASLALRGDGSHLVSLDVCIESMRQTGLDMSSRYKETSLGGLAVNMPHMPNC